MATLSLEISPALGTVDRSAIMRPVSSDQSPTARSNESVSWCVKKVIYCSCCSSKLKGLSCPTAQLLADRFPRLKGVLVGNVSKYGMGGRTLSERRCNRWSSTSRSDVGELAAWGVVVVWEWRLSFTDIAVRRGSRFVLPQEMLVSYALQAQFGPKSITESCFSSRYGKLPGESQRIESSEGYWMYKIRPCSGAE